MFLASQFGTMMRAGGNRDARRKPNAAWAWEGLRRNAAYRRAYFASRHLLPQKVELKTGGVLWRTSNRHLSAEQFGLAAFADPDKDAVHGNVFWRPDWLAGSLDVRLSPITHAEECNENNLSIIMLHRMKSRRVLLETVDGARHILLNGSRFWIQLYCRKPSIIGEAAHVGIRLNKADTMGRNLDTAAQLLSLYRANGGKLPLIGRRKNAEPIERALLAHDIWTGFERPKGGLKDISIAMVGEARVEEDWNGPSRYLKDMAVRARNKGLAFVAQDYQELLSKKAL